MTTSSSSTSIALHPVIAQVTQRIIERSKPLRTAYLEQLEKMRGRGAPRQFVVCESGTCECGDG
jgi:phosphogluconate dehydratase